MVVAEEEAKTKWCPHARVFETDDSGRGVGGLNEKYDVRLGMVLKSKCIASACMMWREVKTTGKKLGFCGLAGR